MTIREAIRRAAARLSESEHLTASAQMDATLLLLHTLGITRAQLFADPDRVLSPKELAVYDQSITRRLTHEPIQYITGEQEFYGLALRVTPAVLIPRPETEHLVESLLAQLSHIEPLKIADIGTGSGAIAIALASQLPRARFVASDISPAALEIAVANAARLQLLRRIRFVESDLFEAIHTEEPFDAVVSNPPYVPLADGKDMHPEVREFEPAAALFAPGNGLDVYRRLIPEAESALKPGGLLALEIGYGQRDALAGLLSGWREVSFVPDLQQIPRVALARRR
jgi:release factor glutamine methyltransferase